MKGSKDQGKCPHPLTVRHSTYTTKQQHRHRHLNDVHVQNQSAPLFKNQIWLDRAIVCSTQSVKSSYGPIVPRLQHDCFIGWALPLLYPALFACESYIVSEENGCTTVGRCKSCEAHTLSLCTVLWNLHI